MAKEKFIYNTQTLRYEKVVEPLSQKLIKAISVVSAVLVTGLLFSFIYDKYNTSPKEEQLEAEIKQLNFQIAKMGEDITKMSASLQGIQKRDATAHRMIFGMDPIDEGVWNGGIGGHEKYGALKNFSNSSELLIATLEKADKLKRQMAIQSASLDTIMMKAQQKEDMLASIPSIKPIREDKLKRKITFLSGFGYRLHPIHKVRKMHYGLDFTTPKGTPIQATGDGKVVRVEKRRTGFGWNVTIDHGYGYKTLYAHMSQIEVESGQEVIKGQVIGKVGSTGTSTAPHLHYEVHFKGKPVNPIHYCMDGLTPEEYQELANAAAVVNQSLD